MLWKILILSGFPSSSRRMRMKSGIGSPILCCLTLWNHGKNVDDITPLIELILV